MRRKQFLTILTACIMLFGLTGCQGDVGAEPIDNEKIIQESQQSLTVTEQTSVNTEISETFSVQVESDATETVKLRFDMSEFVYPDDPLTAENLLEITTAAKVKLCELGETSSDMMSLYRFGLLDVDFDGFPEIFCEFLNGQHNHECRLYSLKEDNFCEKLLEYEAYFEYDGNSVYLQRREYGGGKNIIVYSNWDNASHGVSTVIYEIKKIGDGYKQEEKFHSHWNYISYDDAKYRYEPDIFSFDGNEIEWEEYEKEYMNYMYCAEVKPVEYVYESIDYSSGGSVAITEKHYDELYSLYNVYINSLLNK
ncbi:MAG: hypothetical protein NC120_12165 [Ruminococcus sp.]|nr:hypothetical protein [Ruminococcus sp.]